ncbi:hypothetical protein O6H91_05G068800 [Diphasiastrum complanatum]|uniref:Uncharacterized protein n=1 Tax=Diphasiastrum complanatum TaxID=34168 RepID=A0ACC2DPA2_DIPCM|nr:hypothetical protein O6H91_05G068800 [Diphasiastrum complanatum]
MLLLLFCSSCKAAAQSVRSSSIATLHSVLSLFPRMHHAATMTPASFLSSPSLPKPNDHLLRIQSSHSPMESLPSPLAQAWSTSRHSCPMADCCKDLRAGGSLSLRSGLLASQSWATGRDKSADHRKISSWWETSIQHNVASCKAVKNGGFSSMNNALRHSFVFHLFRLGLGLGLPGAGGHLLLNFIQGAGSDGGNVTLSGASSVGSDEVEGSAITEREVLQERPLRLFSGVYSLPHPDKEAKGGEDAYFVSSEEQALGIADGVGGWASVGVDAGQYARELMLQSMVAVRQEPEKCIDPARVLVKAHSRTHFRGSSTACILTLSEYGLQAANLGDSGFVIVRNGRVIFKSTPQQHSFNFPYQLGSESSDPPSAAEVFSLQVKAGDIIVLGTDGLFDNVFDHELKTIVLKSTQAGLGPGATAKELADFARVQAQDPHCETPFSTAAQFAGVPFYGGKLDDITVIVSFVIVGTENSAKKLERSP